uniref:Uncharacterized protein n=1 Tax=Amaranthus palmeri TaxID=107608 RepID=A0A6C0T530_AMAPA|nr:hypothetical protein AP_R.00g000320-v1.0.a3 [Amaranthus palmeri]QIA97935.1 hypothetical protein AP_R.00g000330-v1.0.a3 [Amaranthus palmeri]QIA97936.1 hypothetical protein AP_R.00g000340-v1.0.a3 [Amaranthus palmeri]QIA97937.1 hypothetical protein AP_R.00g000350-v1.0.a3 [Amaranthus palmeri]QIA97939.1 hypothetical protein AP_R.00g000380-v1.0.a3 [Amaranthus palmeri]
MDIAESGSGSGSRQVLLVDSHENGIRLAKLDDLEKEYDEGMANLSKMLPFTDEVGIEKPLGAGFT